MTEVYLHVFHSYGRRLGLRLANYYSSAAEVFFITSSEIHVSPPTN